MEGIEAVRRKRGEKQRWKQVNCKHLLPVEKAWMPTAGSYQVTRLQGRESMKLWSVDQLKGKIDTWPCSLHITFKVLLSIIIW